MLPTIGKLEVACDGQRVVIPKCHHTYVMDSLHKIPALNSKECSLRTGLGMSIDLTHNGPLTSCFCRRYNWGHA